MKLSTELLQDYLSRTMSVHEQAEALEQAGVEIEQIISSKPLDEKIIVVMVKKVVQHPQADRLRLVTVDNGQAETTLVCGAPNVREGLVTAWAQVGTTLPDGTVLSAAKIRGVVSEGMLCSPVELGISDDHSGIIELPVQTKLGQKLSNVLYQPEIIDITTHANRFDLLSALGLAREIIGQVGGDIKEPKVQPLGAAARTGTVKLLAKSQVRRYLLQELIIDQARADMSGVARRLAAAGIRSIQPAVDVTNLVLLETGQPMHAFDADKVELPIEVRFAKAGESIETLDHVTRKLSAADLVIADGRGPIGLAGVMGGASSAVSATTTRIYLESATFDGATIRKMAQRHGLRTDASARFERNLPIELAPYAMRRALQLMVDMVDGKPQGGPIVIGEADPEPTTITTKIERLNRVLGLKLTALDIISNLKKLSFAAKLADESSAIQVSVPWWRPDIKLAEDLVEEVVRLIGYDQVPATIPAYRPQPEAVRFDRVYGKKRQVKNILKGQGLFEVMTYSFVSAAALQGLNYKLTDHLQLKNPLSSEQAYLRSNLLPSLLATVERNTKYAKEFGVFELSKVFVSKGPGRQPLEPLQAGIMVRTTGPAYPRIKEIFDTLMAELYLQPTIKAKVHSEFTPGLSANWQIGGQTIGRIGELHPELVAAMKLTGNIGYLEFDLDQLLQHITGPFYQSETKFPSVWRDLTFVVKQSVTWQQVQRVIAQMDIAKVQFAGDFAGNGIAPGSKSMTVRLQFSDNTKTLTDEEANLRLVSIAAELKREFSAKISD